MLHLIGILFVALMGGLSLGLAFDKPELVLAYYLFIVAMFLIHHHKIG